MTCYSTFRKIHFYSTMLLIAAVIYIVTFELILASKSWWVVLSISGYSTFIAIFITSLYLFAIFKGVSRIEKKPQEHPLTTSLGYLFFYDSTPALGILAGFIAAWETKSAGNFIFITSAGILWATAIVWIILDPAIGLVEINVPSVRSRRKERLIRERLIKQQHEKIRKKILNEILQNEQKQILLHYNVLKPLAKKLVHLLSSNHDKASIEAIDIGVKAWQLGGLNSMKQLYSMVTKIYKNNPTDISIDRLASWWDGIGNWKADYLTNAI